MIGISSSTNQSESAKSAQTAQFRNEPKVGTGRKNRPWQIRNVEIKAEMFVFGTFFWCTRWRRFWLWFVANNLQCTRTLITPNLPLRPPCFSYILIIPTRRAPGPASKPLFLYTSSRFLFPRNLFAILVTDWIMRDKCFAAFFWSKWQVYRFTPETPSGKKKRKEIKIKRQKTVGRPVLH